MSYPLEADDDLDEEVGFLQGSFAEMEGEYCDEYQDVDLVALGINPARPTKAKPGSEEKVLMLSARYAAGLPLWHTDDCSDHGPRERRIEY